jgi:hypothetical protein
MREWFQERDFGGIGGAQFWPEAVCWEIPRPAGEDAGASDDA